MHSFMPHVANGEQRGRNTANRLNRSAIPVMSSDNEMGKNVKTRKCEDTRTDFDQQNLNNLDLLDLADLQPAPTTENDNTFSSDSLGKTFFSSKIFWKNIFSPTYRPYPKPYSRVTANRQYIWDGPIAYLVWKIHAVWRT